MWHEKLTHTVPDDWDPAPDEELSRGSLVDRYVVLDSVGAGAMGAVYAAHDPKLDRKVALKLLLPGGGSSEAPARLLREAQALAKFEHPNIVSIYDVGPHGEQVWLAMELVEGRELSAWAQEKRRRWTEHLGIFIQVGRGVAAAHQRGLIHRDLKPANILVGDDGRVRVTDFGLARSVEDAGDRGVEELIPESDSDAFSLQLTRKGAVVGTPAYMPPEQLYGGALTPATDQFSFCVSFWELLYGRRPFTAKSPAELAAAIVQGKPATAPGRRVPGWLRRVLERGLSAESGDRYPSMNHLVRELERGRSRAIASRALAAAAAVAMLVGALAAGASFDESRKLAACEATGGAIDDAWNRTRREAVEAALLGTGLRHAADTAERLIPWLDERADSWRTSRRGLCRAAEVDGELPDELYRRGLACLDERRFDLDALVGQLELGTAEGVAEAVPAAAALASPADCADRAFLARLPSLPGESTAEIQAIRAELARAAALELTGSFEEGVELATAALAASESVGWPPAIAAARLALAKLEVERGEPETAAEHAKDAYFGAFAAGAWPTAADAAILLVVVTGHHLGRPERGLLWSRHAELALASAPDPSGTRRARLLNNLAVVEWMRGAYDRAIGLYEDARERWEGALGAEHLQVANTLNNAGLVYADIGDYARAIELHQRALAIREQSLGRAHPHAAASFNNLALAYWSAGDFNAAVEHYQRALTIWERALGPDHRDVALTLNNIGLVRMDQGELDEAVTLYQRSLDIWEREAGPDHLEVARVLGNLALAHAGRGEVARARSLHERSLAIRVDALGDAHPDVGLSLHGMAELALAEGKAAASIELAERSLAIHRDASVSPFRLGQSKYVLAQALWEAGRDRARARGLADEARRLYRAEGETREPLAAEIDAWLEERSDP